MFIVYRRRGIEAHLQLQRLARGHYIRLLYHRLWIRHASTLVSFVRHNRSTTCIQCLAESVFTFNIPCALSPNIDGLLVCRFLCCVLRLRTMTGRGTIADPCGGLKERGVAIAHLAAAPYCGPVIGRIVCG